MYPSYLWWPSSFCLLAPIPHQSGTHAPFFRRSPKIGPFVALSERRLFVLFSVKVLSQQADGGISKHINNGYISLQKFLQPAMNLNNVYGPSAEVKKIVVDANFL